MKKIRFVILVCLNLALVGCKGGMGLNWQIGAGAKLSSLNTHLKVAPRVGMIRLGGMVSSVGSKLRIGTLVSKIRTSKVKIRKPKAVETYLARKQDIRKNGIKSQSGRKLVNSHYSGKWFKSGVTFKKSGHPDFSPYAYKTYVAPKNIKLSGDKKDFVKANRAVFGKDVKPEGFTWHHVEGSRKLQLIPRWLHNSTRHTGGSFDIRFQAAPAK
ncbi:HNH endonuclease [Photobacterium kasasachensis]|uniref:HNH endonuclease n=1 Tax=Photobacterium kasasachensis TaxID=2910240 RepID=UPI003D150EDA